MRQDHLNSDGGPGADIGDEVTWFLTPNHPSRGGIRVDPYPFYDRLRSHDPVYKSEIGPWIATSYDAVLGLLQDPLLSRDIERAWKAAAGSDDVEFRPAQRLIRSGMLWRDPPDHTRLRRLVHRSFTQSAIAKWDSRIDQIARRLLNELRGRDEFDLLHDFAMRLPGIVICEMVGMPLDRLDDYEDWALATIEIQEPHQSEEVLRHADAGALACLAYFDELIEQKRRHPGDDVISALLKADEDEDVKITYDEIVGMCILLHVAGHETTSNVVTNGMYLLSQHPEQYALLRADPSLVPSAVEEMLRYEGSGRNTMPRWALDDTRVGDKDVPAGDQVIGVFGAAHRDPRAFRDPHRFDIARADNPHVAFGFGIHFCLGARLARVEAQTALRLLVTDYPALRLASDDFTWRDSVVLRALDRLPVAWA
ncbi:MAG: cytochrome P450 [Actinobacteria bacterium]|nr:MAG: cytochrome P450 [Actinomycetota bacterium]